MGTGLFFPLAALPFSIIILILYFRKGHIKSKETWIYKTLIISNFIGLCIELLCSFATSIHSDFPLISQVIYKTYLLYLIFWICTLSYYVYSISREENKIEQKRVPIFIIYYIVISIILAILPIDVVIKDNFSVRYTTGLSVQFTYMISFIGIIFIVYTILKNIKKIKNKKYIPIVVFLFIGGVAIALQRAYPQLLLMTYVETLICVIMYFTIENPDVKMLEQVSIAKDAAEKANHAKSDFLSNMSHEIRTPLNAIVGFSESLKEDDIPESAREKVDDIIMASNNLLEIVNGILDISKIEANKLEIINKEYDIKSMLDELVALTKARIGDKGLEFRVNIDKSIPRVLYGDNIRLKQIILNILTNAVKYTKEGFIDFTVSTVIKDNICRLIISVEDSGIGIKEESIPKLFSKFERLNVEKQLTIEGTGLGLAITKKLVELMNGKIVVQSVYGKGSKFTVSIDQRIISVAPEPTRQAAKSESKIIDASGARILLVDDNELNIKVASVLLKKYNFTIDSCTSGLACLAKIKNNEQYDIIFLDDMMPKMNGRETLKKLKEKADFNTPVIALTANAITGMKQEYLDCGFDDYLAKPIEKPELERIIKKYLNKLNSKSANTNMYKETKSVFEKEFTIELPILASAKKQPINFQDKKILLVDDNEINLKVAENILQKYNLDITKVNSGSSCIEKVIENKYDLILMDDMMPELDGCATLDNLNTLEDFNTPVILTTASSLDEVNEKITTHKFAGYLQKPFTKETIEELLTKLLN